MSIQFYIHVDRLALAQSIDTTLRGCDTYIQSHYLEQGPHGYHESVKMEGVIFFEQCDTNATEYKQDE
jgi:hypothetical protein